MKFNRLALIERAKARIAAAEKDAAERTAEEARKAAGAEARHVAQFGEHWAKLADNIRAANRAKRAVTEADVPKQLRAGRGWGGDTSIHTFEQPKPQVHTAQIWELQRLIAVLEAVVDDEVTSSGLAAIGIRNIP